MDFDRFDWERLVDRAELPRHIKTVAYVLAHHANSDGSNVRPGLQLVADILDCSEKVAGDYIARLLEVGLLRLVKKGGGTHRDGYASVYQLTTPGPALPQRLDPDGNRLVAKKKGRTPPRKTELKPASPRTLAAVATDLNPASGDEVVDNPTDLNSASPQSHVDNSADLKSTSDQVAADHDTDANPASGEVADRPEAHCRPTRSPLTTDLKPASYYQGDQPPTTTPRVSELGDHSHLPSVGVIHKASHLDLEDGTSEPPDAIGALPAPAAAPTVTEAQYAEAYEVLSVLPDFGQFLIARATQQYAAQGWTNLPTRVLAVRAAELLQTGDERRSA